MCAVDDYDPPAFFSERPRRCRKPFDCGECEARVERGEVYRFISGMWEGSILTHKHCVGCAELARAVGDVDCSYLFENLLDDAEQAVDPHGLHAEADAAAQGRLIGLLWLARERCDAARETRQLRRAAA